MFAEDEARLLIAAADTPDRLGALVRRRVDGLPLEHLLGWAEFCGLRIAVGPGVFVPRRRTEFLAELGGRLARPGSVVVDLCCGSGAVAAAVAEAVPGVVLHAADVEPEAVRWARHNVAARGGHVHEGDLYAALPVELRGRIDVLVVNAPYVPTGSIGLMPPEARDHEPRVALDGGVDGLDVQRRVTAEAPNWLAPGGSLLIETGERQAEHTLAAMTAAGFDSRVEYCEELWATVLVGTAGGADEQS
ncbi:Release factor glutamine methyltransferase [Streptomyces sp. YIM 130001]|nr:Release factor glutamine methyltransferase [Streptomyces sp. YIM 130001]